MPAPPVGSVLFYSVTLILPGLDSPLQRFDMRESFFLVLFRPTGGCGFLRSGAVEDEFLLFGNLGELFLQFIQVDGAFQVHVAAFLLVVIGAHQEGFAGLNFLMSRTWIDSLGLSHDFCLLSLK
jgi:hypothetical protein